MVFWDEKTIDGLDETRITNIAQKIRTFDGWSRERQPRKTENEFSYDRLTMIQPRIGQSRVRVRVRFCLSGVLRWAKISLARFSGRTRFYLVPSLLFSA